MLESARSLLIPASSYLYYDTDVCCPVVVDPYTYIALLSGIALVTWFLQMTIVMTTFSKRRKKRDVVEDVWTNLTSFVDDDWDEEMIKEQESSKGTSKFVYS